MKRIILLAIAVMSLLSGTLLVASSHAPTKPTLTLAPGDVQPIVCADGSVPRNHLHTNRRDVFCPAAVATATVTTEPTATATHDMPMPTTPPDVVPGWHAPGAHDSLNRHEHGDTPPEWATGAFSQTRESHTGYKGVYDVSPGGVESYFIAHIVATEAARSHGDHDYQLWLRDPDTGYVHYEEGVLCFAQPCTAPTREMTDDDGQRPIVLGERSASDGCETWYSTPGSRIFDSGWTICQRYQAFDGRVLGGDGSYRLMDWIVYPHRMPEDLRALFADDARVEFGVSRISFIKSRDYEADGSVDPVN
jgi:hypothetical protein